jgi:hypothetical protein
MQKIDNPTHDPKKSYLQKKEDLVQIAAVFSLKGVELRV